MRLDYQGQEAVLVAGGRITSGPGDELDSVELLGKKDYRFVRFYFNIGGRITSGPGDKLDSVELLGKKDIRFVRFYFNRRTNNLRFMGRTRQCGTFR